MPRGPGQKKNYNLDYSRFNYLDKNATEHQEVEEGADNIKEYVAPEGMPDMRDVLRTMPPELQEAHHLLNMARANGDKDAERRANELALKAIQNGGPQVQQDFIKTLSVHEPAAAKALEAEFGLTSSAPDTPIGKVEGLTGQIDLLKERMEKGAEQARLQMANLTKQQDEMEKLAAGGPDDFMKFMKQHGINDQDMQKIFGGDESHMEKTLQGMIDKCVKPGQDGGEIVENPEATIKAAEQLHRSICGDGELGEAASSLGLGENGELTIEDRPDADPTPALVRKRLEPKTEEPIVAEHRLQYQKDADGHYTSVELRCTLPGVADMSSVTLDVSEKHIRLSTSASGPKFVVNAGPFPVLIEPGAARAKFSKKRQELSIFVPPKAN